MIRNLNLEIKNDIFVFELPLAIIYQFFEEIYSKYLFQLINILNCFQKQNLISKKIIIKKIAIKYGYVFSKTIFFVCGSGILFFFNKYFNIKQELLEQFSDYKMISEINLNILKHQYPLLKDKFIDENYIPVPIQKEIFQNKILQNNTKNINNMFSFYKHGIINLCFELDNAILIKKDFQYLNKKILGIIINIR